MTARTFTPQGAQDPVDLASAPGMQELSVAELEDLNDSLLGDAATLGDSRITGFEWQVWRMPETGALVPANVKPGDGTYCCALAGPLNLERVRSLLGGGVYRIIGRGRDAEGRARRVVHTFQIAGKPLTPPSPESLRPRDDMNGSAPPAAVPSSDPAVRELADQVRNLTALVMAQRAAGADPFDRALEQVTKLAALFGGLNRPQNPDAIFGSMLGVFEKGIELGTKRDASEGSEWIEAAKAIGPQLLDTIKTVAAASRPAPPPRARTASGATVVTDPNVPAVPAPEAAVITPADPIAVRMGILVETLARAITRGTHPLDLATTTENMLSDTELATLKLATSDTLLEQLAPHTSRFEIFAAPHARDYLAQFLEILRMSPEQRDQLADDLEGEGDTTP